MTIIVRQEKYIFASIMPLLETVISAVYTRKEEVNMKHNIG